MPARAPAATVVLRKVRLEIGMMIYTSTRWQKLRRPVGRMLAQTWNGAGEFRGSRAGGEHAIRLAAQI